MHCPYQDIRDHIKELPQWWDEAAVPRYCAFAPDHCADIYAREVVLVRIACQACGHEFDVCMSSNSMALVDAGRWPSVFDEIRSGTLHYGDPPNYCCMPGSTMNCTDLAVLQAWRRDDSFRWVREPELEVPLNKGD